MTAVEKKRIIDGLEFTIDMCLFDPLTGKKLTKEQVSAETRITLTACEEAIAAISKYTPVEQRRKMTVGEVITAVAPDLGIISTESSATEWANDKMNLTVNNDYWDSPCEGEFYKDNDAPEIYETEK